MTNGDRIRQMSNEELAEFILFEKDECLYCKYKDNRPNCKVIGIRCSEGIKAYLESEEE